MKEEEKRHHRKNGYNNFVALQHNNNKSANYDAMMQFHNILILYQEERVTQIKKKDKEKGTSSVGKIKVEEAGGES